MCKKLDFKAACKTATTPFPGAAVVAQPEIIRSALESRIDVETVTYLVSLYGSRFTEVLEMAERGSRGKQPLCHHTRDIVAQIWYAVAEESAITVSDFMLRRSGLGLAECQGLDAVEIVGKEMGRLLAWSPEEQQRQIPNTETQLLSHKTIKRGRVNLILGTVYPQDEESPCGSQ